MDGETVTRLVCAHFHGPPPTPFHQAAHSCNRGGFGCVAHGHLSWKTPSENAADQLIHGTRHHCFRGTPTVTLTEAQVREIRRLLTKTKMSYRQIGKQAGVSRQTVGNIKHRKTWAHLK
jgi:DNA-binding CsgD family transcriptional regulator